MNTLARRIRERHASGDAGFSMIEMVISLMILALVTTASIEFFINNLRSVNGQSQRQQAVFLADQQLENVQALPIGNLVKGRTQASVNTLYATPVATSLNIAGQDDIGSTSNWDPLASSSSTPSVPPITGPNDYVFNGVHYVLYTFIDACYYSTASGLCGPTNSTGLSQEYRATVDTHWQSNGLCVNGCDYSTSTIIDPKSDPQFNSNLIAISGNYYSVGSNLSPGINPSVINDNGGSCVVNGTTYSGTKIVVTGTGFKANIRVWISSGGGTISAGSIYQPSATEVDFCLVTADVPGAYTISIINTDGGHIQLPLTEIPSVATSVGWAPGAQNVTVTGSGWESGVVFTATNGVGWTSQSALVTANITADSVQLNGFVGPVDGGTSVLKALNPDGSSATYTINAPKVTSALPGILVGATTTLNITGTGFDSVAPKTGVAVTNGNGTATIAPTSATAATLTLKPTSTGTETVYLYNPDGGYTSAYTFVVDAVPTVTAVSPTTVVPGVASTVTITGTGFLPGITASTTNGTVGTVTYVSSTQVNVLLVTASTSGSDSIKLTNLDGGNATGTVTAAYPAPTVSSVSPTSLVAGTSTTVTINGTGFRGGMTASTTNGTVGTLTIVTSTQVTLTLVKPTATKTDVITLTNSDGQTATATFAVTPVISAVSPSSVVHSTATTFSLTGAGFASGATVTITENGTTLAPSSVTVSSSTAMSFKATTTSSKGTFSFVITITNTDGSTATKTVSLVAS